MTGTQTLRVSQFGHPTLSKDGRTIMVHIPIKLRHQGGREQVVTRQELIGRNYSMNSPSIARRQYPHLGDVREIAKAENIKQGRFQSNRQSKSRR